MTDLTITQIRKHPENSKQLIKIYNILANEADTVTPFLKSNIVSRYL